MFIGSLPFFFLSAFGGIIKIAVVGGVIAFIIYLITKNKKMDNQSQSQDGQQGNVLPGQEQSNVQNVPPPKKKQSKYSALSVFMAVILFGILIMFGERSIFDLNRFLNPAVDKEYTTWMNQNQFSNKRAYDIDAPKMPVRSYEMAQDYTAISSTQVYYGSTERGRYMMYKLIIHAAVIIPIFLFAFVLFYFKKKNHHLRPLLISFLFVAFWLMFHLLGETVEFVMDEYRNVAIYVILFILAVVFGVLAYYTQIKQQKKGTNV